jgi:Tol biopolymer transport system component
MATGIPTQLTSGDNEDSHPVWSSDSRFVYFLRNHQDIYSVPRTGGEAKPLTHYQSFSVTLDYPALSGDGKKILFTRIDKAGDIYLLEPSRDK